MTRLALIPAMAALGLCAAESRVQAHHSWGAFYDMCSRVTVEGAIDTIEWKDPHPWIFLKTDDGTLYRAEMTGPRALEREGVKPDTLKPGDRIIVTGSPMRDPVQIRARFPDMKPSPGWETDPRWKTTVAAVWQIRRASDGWNWNNSGGGAPSECQR
jgi:hypothetical protein